MDMLIDSAVTSRIDGKRELESPDVNRNECVIIECNYFNSNSFHFLFNNVTTSTSIAQIR